MSGDDWPDPMDMWPAEDPSPYQHPGPGPEPEPGQEDTAGRDDWVPRSDVAAAWDDPRPDIVPTELARDDGMCLLYPGKTHTLAGAPGSGKTWLAVYAVHQAVMAGKHAAVWDFEDQLVTWISRLKGLGTTREQAAKYFHYHRPDGPLLPEVGWVAIRQWAADKPLRVVVIDGVTNAMTDHAWNPNDMTDVQVFNKRVPMFFAGLTPADPPDPAFDGDRPELGPAVLLIDHIPKPPTDKNGKPGTPRYAIGSQHKMAAVTGASFIFEVVDQFVRGRTGRANILVTKDRQSQLLAACLPGSEVIAQFILEGQQDGSNIASLVAQSPVPVDQATGQLRYTGQMERICKYILANPGVTKQQIIDNITGKTDIIKAALRTLVEESYVWAEKGPGNSVLHTCNNPYYESQDPKLHR